MATKAMRVTMISCIFFSFFCVTLFFCVTWEDGILFNHPNNLPSMFTKNATIHARVVV